MIVFRILSAISATKFSNAVNRGGGCRPGQAGRLQGWDRSSGSARATTGPSRRKQQRDRPAAEQRE